MRSLVRLITVFSDACFLTYFHFLGYKIMYNLDLCKGDLKQIAWMLYVIVYILYYITFWHVQIGLMMFNNLFWNVNTAYI